MKNSMEKGEKAASSQLGYPTYRKVRFLPLQNFWLKVIGLSAYAGLTLAAGLVGSWLLYPLVFGGAAVAIEYHMVMGK